MNRLLGIFLLLFSTAAYAADNAVIVTPGVGVTVRSVDIGAGVQAPGHAIVNATGTQIGISGAPLYTQVPSGGIASGAVASGAVASGAVAAGALAAGAGVDGWDLTQGAKADSACATDSGTCTVTALLKKVAGNLTTLNTTAGASIAAGTNYIGKTRPTDGTNDAVLDPCQVVAKTNLTGTQTTSTKIISGTSAKKTYICSFVVIAGAAEIMNITAGTGATCGTGTSVVLGSSTAANGLSFAANGGLTLGNGAATVIAVTAAAADDVCLTQSGSNRLTYHLTYVQL